MAHPSGWDIKYTYSLYYSVEKTRTTPYGFFPSLSTLKLPPSVVSVGAQRSSIWGSSRYQPVV